MPLALTNISPAAGQLHEDAEAARWVKITADLEVDVGTVPLLFAKLGDDPYTWHLVYDGAEFSPLFAEHSTVTPAGQVFSFSILPVGGWWATPIEIAWGQFTEAPES